MTSSQTLKERGVPKVGVDAKGDARLVPYMQRTSRNVGVMRREIRLCKCERSPRVSRINSGVANRRENLAKPRKGRRQTKYKQFREKDQKNNKNKKSIRWHC